MTNKKTPLAPWLRHLERLRHVCEQQVGFMREQKQKEHVMYIGNYTVRIWRTHETSAQRKKAVSPGPGPRDL